MALIYWGEVEAASDLTMATVTNTSGTRFRAAVVALIRDVAAGIIASDPTIIQAAEQAVQEALEQLGIYWADIEGYAFAIVANDGRVGELALDESGQVPQWALDRWGQRMNISGSTGSMAVDEVLLVVCGGQSKATRRGVGDGADAGFPAHPRIYFYQHSTSQLVPDAGVGWLGRGFALEYLKEHPNAICVTVEAAVGSTGFSTTSINPPPEGYFAGSGTWDRTLTDDANRYPQSLLLQRVSAAHSAASTRWGKTPRRVLLFSMGEADKANSIGGMPAAEYQAKQDDLFTWLRGQTNWSGAPIIVGSLSYTQIHKTPAGTAYDRVHMNTPARVPLTAYDRAVEGYDENTSFNTHQIMVGQELQGRNMFRHGWFRAVQNDPAVTSTAAILPPANVRVHRVGSTVKVEWDHPLCRVTRFVLETSADGATGWTARTLSSDLAIEHTISSQAPVYVRLRSFRDDDASYYTTVKGA